MEGYVFMPYTKTDGVPTFKDSEIRGLWRRVWEEGLGEILFHDGSIRDEDHFLQLMKGQGVSLWVVLKEGYPCAFWWLNRIEQTHAYCHFTFFVEMFHTKDTLRIGKEAMRICFDELGFKLIMGMLPSSNVVAIRYLQKVGLHVLGEVPHLMCSRGLESVPGTMLYITREDLKDES